MSTFVDAAQPHGHDAACVAAFISSEQPADARVQRGWRGRHVEIVAALRHQGVVCISVHHALAHVVSPSSARASPAPCDRVECPLRTSFSKSAGLAVLEGAWYQYVLVVGSSWPLKAVVGLEAAIHMHNSALTAVVDDKIWILDRPVWFGGVRLRARTTVVRLDDGSLLLHTPAPPTDVFAEQLRALGPVRWLVVPNCWHHLGTPAAAAHFPAAKVVAPASALDRNKALRLHMDIHDAQFGEQVPELEALPLRGVPFWDETVLYHRPTQTLLGADIVCWANANDHWTWRCGARLTGCYERVRVPPDARKKIPDQAAAARSIRAMLERPAERLIIGHGDVIEAGWRERLAQAWRLEGVEA